MFIHKYPHKKAMFRFRTGLISLLVVVATILGSYFYTNAQNTIQDQKQAEILRDITAKSIISAKEAKKREPVYITLPGASPIRAIVDDYSKANSIWALVSKSHSIPTDYVPSPIKIPDVLTRTDKSSDERSVRSDIEAPLINMFSAASTAGYHLMVGSGYRSATLQAIYFNSLSSSVGDEAANQAIARPGQSEHQTALAVDISAVSQECYLAGCFETTGDGQWLANNSYKYGFILRYPKGKESVTEYQYEPWHFRYVGVDLATALYESGLTLDQAWSYLEQADATLKQNGAI